MKMIQFMGEREKMGHSWKCACGMIMAMGCAVSVVGCAEAQSDEIVVHEGEKVVTIGVTGGFVIETEGMSDGYETGTRATLSEAGVVDLWVLDYVDGELKQSVKQSSGDAGFGNVEMKMKYGQHKVVAVAGCGDGGVLNVGDGGVGVVVWERVKDTFGKAVDVNVSEGSEGDVSVVMDRMVGAVRVLMKDAIPEEAKTMRVEMKRCQELKVPGLGIGEVSVSGVESEFPASWKGKKDKYMTVFTICGEEEIVTDVCVTVKDGDGEVIADVTVEDVSIGRNKRVTMSGCLFGGVVRGMDVSVGNVWDEESKEY